MSAKKVMLLGDIGVGKTSLVRRLVLDVFEGDYRATIGVDLYKYDVEVPEADGAKTVGLVIWDTDGNFGEGIFNQVYVRGASAALIVADVTRPTTQSHMITLAKGFNRLLPGREVILVLNKADLLPPGGEPELAEELHNVPYTIVRTSAKTGGNVKDAFIHAARAILRRGG
jgi:Ras-related protein Rab-5C